MPEGWKKSVEIVRRAMERSGLPFTEAEGEAAFYGPKVDFQIKSAMGREESASTNQLDFLATERFALTYTDSDGTKKPVYVIHRAPLGSHERFIAFLIEHYAGAFPFWMAPVQAIILPVSEKFKEYAEKVREELKAKNIRAESDSSNETLGKKIRAAEMQKIPYLLVVGEREQESNTVALRERGKGDQGSMSAQDFLKKLKPLSDDERAS